MTRDSILHVLVALLVRPEVEALTDVLETVTGRPELGAGGQR